MALDNAVLEKLWQQVIQAAMRSKSRKSSCPKVGALIGNAEGDVLASASHDEEINTSESLICKHAEQVLIDSLKLLNTTTRHINGEYYFFSTLEPCNIRSEHQIPCAHRIGTLDFAEIHIGLMDPEPGVYGQGVSYLIRNRGAEKVKYAPREIRKQIIRDIYPEYIPVKEARFKFDKLEEEMPLVVGHNEEEKYLSIAYAFSKLFTGTVTWLFPELPSFGDPHKFQAWWAQGVFENAGVNNITMYLHERSWKEGLNLCNGKGMKELLLNETRDRPVYINLVNNCNDNCACRVFRGAILEQRSKIKYLIHTIYSKIFDSSYSALLVCEPKHLALLKGPLSESKKTDITGFENILQDCIKKSQKLTFYHDSLYNALEKGFNELDK